MTAKQHQKNSRMVVLTVPGYPKRIETTGKIDGAVHVMTVHRGMNRRDFLAAARIAPWVRRLTARKP
jgi:hypothetical protein